MPQIQIDPFYIITAFVGLVVWAVRLEALALSNKKEIGDNKENNVNMWNKIDTLQSSITQISLSLGRIEGKLENKNNQ